MYPFFFEELNAVLYFYYLEKACLMNIIYLNVVVTLLTSENMYYGYAWLRRLRAFVVLGKKKSIVVMYLYKMNTVNH